ncbi:MAG TPA: potassium channel family protein [Acidimicrobiales bacterium]
MSTPPDAAGTDHPPRPLAPPQVRRPLLRGGLVLAAVLVIYYAVPVGEIQSDVALALSAVGLLVGVGVLGWLVVRQARMQLGARADESVSIQSLLVLAYVVVPMFALGYVGLERADPDQFVELETKTDALYFAISTLATVGFGDVAAEGQLARALVTVQIAFDLVFVAALGSLVTRLIRRRIADSHGEEKSRV